jgi:glutathione S-transferase
MEVARVLLAISGKFPNFDYVDGRYESPAENLDANLGRMPVLELNDGVSIGQSNAIYYYLASENNLMGKTNVEGAQIISIAEHLREVVAAYRALVPYGTAPTEEDTKKWFEEGSKDSAGTAERSGRSTRYLTWFLGRIEKALEHVASGRKTESPFAVGDQISLADVLMYNTFAEHLRTTDLSPDSTLGKHVREPFGDAVVMSAVLHHYPRISSSIASVANHPNFQKWLDVRGVQGF